MKGLIISISMIAFACSQSILLAATSDGFLQVKRWAQEGDVDAQYELGNRYYRGGGGAPQDYELAYEWYLKSAEQGHADAMHALFVCHWNKVISGANDSAGFSWLLRSAESCGKYSPKTIGNLYLEGRYVKVDSAAALKWFTISYKRADNTMKTVYSSSLQELGSALKKEVVDSALRASEEWFVRTGCSKNPN